MESNSAVSRELSKLMKIPLDVYNDVMTVLKLEHYGPLFEYFDYSARKALSVYILSNALDNQTNIPTPEQVKYRINTVRLNITRTLYIVSTWREIVNVSINCNYL